MEEDLGELEKSRERILEERGGILSLEAHWHGSVSSASNDQSKHHDIPISPDAQMETPEGAPEIPRGCIPNTPTPPRRPSILTHAPRHHTRHTTTSTTSSRGHAPARDDDNRRSRLARPRARSRRRRPTIPPRKAARPLEMTTTVDPDLRGRGPLETSTTDDPASHGRAPARDVVDRRSRLARPRARSRRRRPTIPPRAAARPLETSTADDPASHGRAPSRDDNNCRSRLRLDFLRNLKGW
jgi:hypothetical protein